MYHKFYFPLICLGIFLLGACKQRQQNADTVAAPVSYPTQVLHYGNALSRTEYPVVIRGQEDIEIKPRIDGFIDAIYVDEGSTVRRGQKLFDINSPQTQQSVIAARESVNSATAQVNTARLNVERLRPLADRNIISTVQLETQQNAYQSALASQAQAQANLVNAQEMSRWINVTSPVDGVVGTIPFRRGSLVNSGNVLTTISSTGNVYAYFSMNEKSLMDLLNSLEGTTQEEKIRNIPEVTLILASGDTFPERGKVETIAGSINTSTGSASLRARFANDNGLLRSGTSGIIIIPREIQQVMIIPQQATFSIQDKVMVYKVEGDSVVQKVISVIPLPGGKEYAVTDGLIPGERIVSDGVATLSNGKKINIR